MNERSLADDQGKATGLVEAGRQLAEARAAAGLTQNQLAGQMHMGEEQLAALERGDQAELPEPVFIKAMVRRLSSHLGLDADAMVQTLGPLTTNQPKRPTPGATTLGITPQKQRTVHPLPLVALTRARWAWLCLLWSNSSRVDALRPRVEAFPITPFEPSEGKPSRVAEVAERAPMPLIVPASPHRQTWRLTNQQ
jgi:Uncharacterized protein conserved in bacteria